MKNVKCLVCGWVHFAVSRAYAEDEIARFNAYYETLPPESKRHYRGPSSISSYDKCVRCGDSYKNTRDALPEEVPYGSTINPILSRED